MDLIGSTIAALAGALAVPGVLAFWVQWQRSHPSRGRAPVREKLLRPAGYSLGVQRDEVWENLLSQVLWLVGCGAVLGLAAKAGIVVGWGLMVNRYSLSSLNLSDPVWIQFLLFCCGFGGGAIYFAARIVRMWRTSENLRLGLRGEQAVGECLAHPEIAKAGYRVFHDVPGDGAWNIDHVVVGPGGVFVIETKARTKRPTSDGRRDYEVLCEGRTLKFPDWDDVKTIEQVERNARWLQGWLGGYVMTRIECVPVVALPGWLVSWGKPQPNTVHVFNPKGLPKFLSTQAARLEPRDLVPILKALDERCRTLEF